MSGIETTGAIGVAAAKYAVFAKLGAMFGASAFGAALIAAYHPETRKETWWRALGAGVGGIPLTIASARPLQHYVPWVFSGDTIEDLGVLLTIAFVLGSVFWGIVGALQNLQKRIKDKGGDMVADKIGLDKSEIHP